jgi:tRNA U34 2-thiouridine synthase MnmA/TrmU
MSPSTAIVLLSGGIDSAACAHLLKAQEMKVEGIFSIMDNPPLGASKSPREQSQTTSTSRSLC